jgi:gliding motility-associated protein GldM
MAGHKETPRQKLIGMMYLVLTAMLALNVSRQVLEGYSAVNDSLVSTNESFGPKREGAYANLEKEFNLNQIEVGPFWDKAKVAMKLSTEMVQYIEGLRTDVIAQTEGIPIDSARVLTVSRFKKKDNYTIPTSILIGPLEDGSKGRAKDLAQKVLEYRKKMIQLIGLKYRDQLKLGLDVDGKFKGSFGQNQTWAFHYFFDIPLAAVVPILNKLIAEVNNAELEVVNGLLRESIAEDFKFDRIEAKVLPISNSLFIGDPFEAEVIVAAYDTSHSPSPTVYLMRGADSLSTSQREKSTLIAREKGRLNIKFPTTGLGIQKYAGFVSVPTNSGRERTYHFNGEYFVSQPSITVSATKMNVLYVGVDNPISISASGVSKADIIPTISAGTIAPDKNDGGWIAKVPAGSREVTISVAVRMNNGLKQMGVQTYRVKRVPDPVPSIANKSEGFLTKESMIEAGKISIKMPNDFDFEYSSQIISFRMTMERGFTVSNYDAQSGNLTDEMIQQLRRTNRGQGVVFEDIIMRGSDGVNRTLSPLYITIK